MTTAQAVTRYPGYPGMRLTDMDLDELEAGQCDAREDAESRTFRGWEGMAPGEDDADRRTWPVWSQSSAEQWREAHGEDFPPEPDPDRDLDDEEEP